MEVYENMMKDPKNIVPTNELSFEKVRTEKFALIRDETMSMMNTRDDCMIRFIKEKFYKSGYALAFPENWIYKKYFDNA